MMDTYQLVSLLVKMGVFFGPKDRFVIKDYLVTLLTMPDFNENRLEVSERHPVLTGGFIPWYSYDHGADKGHCFHAQALNAKILRQVLSAAIIKWYDATAVEMMTESGTYLSLIDSALTLDPEFTGHIKTVKTGIRKATRWEFTPNNRMRAIIEKRLLPYPSAEQAVVLNPWGMPFTPYSGGIHMITALNKEDTKMPRIDYRDAVANLASEEKLRFEGNHYIPRKAEPSPFGEKAVGVDDHPWVAWRRSHYSTPVGVKGDEHRRALVDVLENEPLRQINSIGQVNCERERHGHLTLGWVICMYYNFGGKSWEEIHQVGVNRINYYREHGKD
jgi:hypothetical protein